MLKIIQPIFSQFYTSNGLQKFRERKALRTARKNGEKIGMNYYFRVNDPYAYLALQLLPKLSEHFSIPWTAKILPQEIGKTALSSMQQRYALYDATWLSDFYGLMPFYVENPLSPKTLATVENAILNLSIDEDYSKKLFKLLQLIWQNDFANAVTNAVETTEENSQQLAANLAELHAKGHYASSMVYFCGEWYSIPDRLWHLSSKLTEITGKFPWEIPTNNHAFQTARSIQSNSHQDLNLFFSFRSPYSYLALERTFSLAEKYQLKLMLKPILPMVMRGIPVSRTKRLYILRDAKREANRLKISFGKICDPLGIGIEHCMKGFFYAKQFQREKAYVLSIMRGIWSEGKNVAKESVFRKLVERAGLDWQGLKAQWQGAAWQTEIENNRQALNSLGLWGVPAFQFNDFHFWGQDRLPLLQKMLEFVFRL